MAIKEHPPSIAVRVCLLLSGYRDNLQEAYQLFNTLLVECPSADAELTRHVSCTFPDSNVAGP